MGDQGIEKIISNFFEREKIEAEQITIPDFVGYKIKRESLLKCLSFLSVSYGLRFTVLTDLFAADFPERIERFEIVYNLLSLKLNKRLLLKIETSEEEPIPSCSKIFPVADWYEREIFDMFGVKFSGHPNLTRILTDYGFVGHPLKKDFPLTGYVEVTYDEKLEKVIYEPVKLDREYRSFDFSSPWSGPLPGDEKAIRRKD